MDATVAPAKKKRSILFWALWILGALVALLVLLFSTVYFVLNRWMDDAGIPADVRRDHFLFAATKATFMRNPKFQIIEEDVKAERFRWRDKTTQEEFEFKIGPGGPQFLNLGRPGSPKADSK